jgi:L-amino acid N-acyltransferase YncA
MIHMRPATLDDGDALLTWRNDPVTCANSRSTATVPREDHQRWMQFNVTQGYPQHLVLIADSDVGRVGVVRFDASRGDVMTYEASITVAPEHRGRGHAKTMLSEACAYMTDYTIDAVIRADNMPSRRAFEACGFDQIGSDHGFIKYRKEPVIL